MMLKRIFLLSLLVVMTDAVNAQVRMGARVGMNVNCVSAEYAGSSVNEDSNPLIGPGNPDNFRAKTGYQLGIVVDWEINDRFALQSGLTFTELGFKDHYRGKTETAEKNYIRKFSLYYFQIPLYAQYKYNLGYINLVAQAGPYFGYGLSGRQKYTQRDKERDLQWQFRKVGFGNSSSSDIRNAFDYGVGAGLGVEFGGLQMMFNYQHGLYKMRFEKEASYYNYYDVRMRNYSFSLTLTYVFGKIFL